MLANKLIHEISSEAVTIAEDVSGYVKNKIYYISQLYVEK